MKFNLSVIIVSFCSCLLFSCEEEIVRNGQLEEYIPENTVAVFKIKQLNALQTDINNNTLFKSFKEKNIYRFLGNNSSVINNFEPNSESLLCFNSANDSTFEFTFISKNSKNIFKTDSLKNKKVETLLFDDKSIQKVTLENSITYSAIVDSIFIATSSQKLLESILEGKTEKDATFQKINSVQNGSDFGVLLKNRNIPTTDSIVLNLAKWFSLDVEIKPAGISANGIAIGRDSLNYLVDIFDEQVPQQNEIALITPNNAKSVLAFTFSDIVLLKKNLNIFRGNKVDSLQTNAFEAITEIGNITLPSQKLVILKSENKESTDAALAQYVTQGESYDDVSINSFSEEGLLNLYFNPMISGFRAKYICTIDDFFIFSESIEAAKQLISDYKNGNVISKNRYYEDAIKGIGSTSSLLFINFDEKVPQLLNLVLSPDFSAYKTGSEKYSMAIFQLSYDRDFAHLAFVSNENSKGESTQQTTISDEITVSLENTPLDNLQFYSFGKNADAALLVQDFSNTLYCLSKTGKTLWTKKLDSALLGTFEEVDVLKNGTNQIAFTTKNGWYIIDKNGKDVGSFPINFKDNVTQPVAVFDYDNNKNYRFAIIQGKNVLMYDASAKAVKGFTYTKAKSPIVLPPKHFRMNGKDYLSFAEENGTLNILSRTGKSRVSIAKKFDFGVNNIFEQGGNFNVITSDNNLYTISQSGKIGSKKLSVSTDASIAIAQNNLVSLGGNILKINDTEVEIPIGSYSKPTIYSVNNKLYVAFTETLEKKIFLYGADGKLIAGSSKNGKGSVSMIADTSDKILNFAAKGEGKQIKIYSLNF